MDSEVEERINSIETFQDLLSSEYFNTPIAISETSTIKPIQVFLMALKHCLTHSLCANAFVNSIKLINNIHGREIVPTRIRFFNKLFDSPLKISFHTVCPHCGMHVGDLKKLQKKFTCSSCHKLIDFTKSKMNDFLIVLDPSEELKRLVQDNDEFYDRLVSGITHESEFVRDIHDGKKYRDFVRNLPPDKKNRTVP